MTQTASTQTMFNTGMLKAGAAITGSGLLIATVGMGLTSLAVIRGAMAWSRAREVSPAAMAAARLDRARHASVAGMHAWREHAAANSAR